MQCLHVDLLAAFGLDACEWAPRPESRPAGIQGKHLTEIEIIWKVQLANMYVVTTARRPEHGLTTRGRPFVAGDDGPRGQPCSGSVGTDKKHALAGSYIKVFEI